ncbi:hypothetical protein [Ekhidna sp.]|uniref:hypothetical protein n=1 Tax=Ekhidna sp. TaxID=2608089 RepID=UPI003B5ABEDB
MKAKLFTVFFIATFFAKATVIIVDNNGNAPVGVETSLTNAISNASAGDTLLIIPSSSTYGNMNVTKQLTIIGVGFNPDMEIPFTSKVNAVTIYTAASGAKIIGLEVTSTLVLGNTGGALTNVVIENNKLDNITTSGISSLTNVLIRQNVIRPASAFVYSLTLNTANQSNIRVANNVFSNTGTTNQFRGPYITTGGVTFDHNTFLGTASQYAFYQIINCLVTNNIFVTLSPAPQAASSNILYKNNLSNGFAFGDINGTNINIESNIDNTSPTFVNMPLSTYLYDYTLDPYLDAGSAGEGAGTDGTNLGLSGGTSPFKLSGSVLPVVRRFDLPANITESSDADATIEVTGN